MIERVLGLCCIACFALLIGACSETKVYIPPEWQTAEPAQQSAGSQPPVPYPQASREPSASNAERGAALQPAPQIRESEITAGPEKGALPPKMVESPPPQQLASMHLVDEANSALAQGKPDAAIPMLEKAISVDVQNGEAFFGLARAWGMKRSRNKAIEFARKAEVLFQGNPGRLKEVYLFEAGIYKEIGETGKMQQYLDSASKLR